MTGHKTKLPGYMLTKAGKLERSTKPLDASARARQRGSKRVRAVKPMRPGDLQPIHVGGRA